MEKQILENYEISQKTIALIPAAHMEYATIAIEADQLYYIKKFPLQLIDRACLKGFSSYDGRRKAVGYQLGIRHKVPIPISPHEQIYAFPTHSPTQFDCFWLFYQHVRTVKPCPKTNGVNVTFKTGQQLSIPVSYYTIEKQLQRTAQCIVRFSYETTTLFNPRSTPALSY
ncbi:competence protein ComK [Anaerobacillus isosaccharinicus]|uniref:Competence protein ComK n=1 Tax=Anaerobacillus isosaccharinicus TaxID=1532552 RepID=A0A1S2LS68_9BACI|nr:competence protein ComK [Anaerobacillus isosaccharinicus]MBA5584437.1 competence protein ComK [Anaerobacillus isosaccharinicus]QOY37175.1 competence protein ComK [Anaerobacillus isosaccharinicus]